MRWIRKDVIKLTLPILVEQAFVMSMGMINTMMAGHVGKEAVSAIGMVDSINNIFIAFFSALAVGGTVVVAQYIGQANVKKANEAMKQALYSGLMISLLITLLTWVFKSQLIGILFGSAEKKVISNAYIYMGITLITYPLITIDLISNGILRGAGDTKTPMKIVIFMNIINVILTYSFINIFNLGVEGAALGIAVARSLGAIVIFLVLIRGSRIIKLSKLRKFSFNKELLKSIYGIGIPASIESLLFNGGKLITQIYIVDMGTISLAANAVTGSIAGMLNVPGNALCTAATALVGQHMGRNEKKEAKGTLSYITKLSTVSLIVLAVVSLPFATILSSLYTNNKDIIHLSANILRINAIFIPTWSLSFVLPSGLKGAGDAKYTLVTTIIGMWVFRITLGYLLAIPLKLGLMGVWLGMFVDWTVRGVLYYIRFRSGKWQNHDVIKKAA